jgi:hypothetical protein
VATLGSLATDDIRTQTCHAIPDACLHGSEWYIEQASYLGLGQFAVNGELYGFALDRGEVIEGGAEAEPEGNITGEAIARRDRLTREIEGRELSFAVLATSMPRSENIDAAVAGDADEPGLERATGWVESSRPLPATHEDILGYFLGQPRFAHEPECNRVDEPAVSFIYPAKRVFIATSNPVKQRHVAGAFVNDHGTPHMKHRAR